MWRPRKSGSKLNVLVELWRHDTLAARRAVTEQAERLAGFRNAALGKVDFQ
jgi:hypothetical protein